MQEDVTMASEEDLYANDSPSSVTIANTLKTKSLEQLLADDKAEIDKENEMLRWYHGKISRENAEKLLKEAVIKYKHKSDMGGLFLVRNSTVSSTDFSLSLTADGRTYHFQIQEKKEGYYHIDDGPLIHGLDFLVQYYTEAANGLPTKLESFCQGLPPPHKVCKAGPTTLLHRAVMEGEVDIIKKIMESPIRPDINGRNVNGATAVHMAAYRGRDDILQLLLKAKPAPDLTLKDRNGHTPLHRACVGDQPSTVRLLIRKGHCDPQVRCPQTGWVPLHEAAMKGSVQCIKALLDLKATPYPRNDSGETPVDVAEKYRRLEVVQIFADYQPPPQRSSRKDWYHPELDRQGAIELLEMHGLPSGLFLIRPSKRQDSWHALSICFQRTPYHYEIKNTHYRNRFVHFIDDGPLLLSLEHLVDHYSLRADGLPCALRHYINTAHNMVAMLADDCTNPPDTPSSHDKPNLPPRCSSVNDEHPPSSPTTPEPLSPASRPPVPSNPPPSGRPPVSMGEEELYKINVKHIKRGAEIGQGEYGSVMKGTLHQYKDKKQKPPMEVALKVFHDASVENRENFLREAVVMQQLDHPCIVKLLGVCQGPPLMLVEEYLSKGSMLDFLLDYPSEVHVKPELYLWASQIASGMMYLEIQQLVHRDLAARNILVMNKKRVKISDFGLSRATGSGSDYYKASHGGRWPIKWYAPECVNYGHFSHPSDVWSFGITLWEMFSYGASPYGEMKGIEVVGFIENGKRLSRPEKCPQVVYDMMYKCWNAEACKRPTFRDLNKHFEEDPIYADVRNL